MTTQLQFNLMPERRIWSVTELTVRIRDLLARNFTDILVQGEISNCREASSGHIYCTLKDERTQIRCVCFKTQLRGMKFRPEDGLRVTVRGSISVYEARGDYQIYIESIEPVGLGALQLAFEQLKKRLEAEGLFAAERKKALPVLPRCIGLITSPSGAAVRDVVRILRRRFPNVHLTLYPVRVQGDGAAAEIVRALEFFNRRQSVDVVILARGGGSMEDLWSFNEEIVVRAIAASSIAIISGVGHETDFTIADFVADVRASTPSAAAELVVQTRREFDKHIQELRENLVSQMRYRVAVAMRRVHELSARRAFRRPLDLLRQQRQRSDEMTSRLALGLRARLEQARRRFNVTHLRIVSFDFHKQIVRLRNRTNEYAARIELALRGRVGQARRRHAEEHLRLVSFDFRGKVGALRLLLERRQTELSARWERVLRGKHERVERLRLQLEERSPLRVLERGYAIATDAAGNVLRDAAQVAVGDGVNVQLHRGRLITEVKRTEAKEEK
ncbi:MAG TPA: exodeoxyribonuclease VII large subunit [Candidatus Acidoferrum sp.]|jgi:exodeoxyribonuclease VII large subunit